MSISPGDRLEFVGDRLRFKKSSPKWRIIGREEIEEIEEGSTEIGRQGARRRIEQARISSRSTGGEGRSAARSTGVHDVHMRSTVEESG